MIYRGGDLTNAKILSATSFGTCILEMQGEEKKTHKLKYTGIIKGSSRLYSVWAQEVSVPNAEFS